MVNNNKSDLQNNSRRQFIGHLSKLVGGLSATALVSGNKLAVAMAFNADNQLTQGKVFTKHELETLSAICETVIPQTETPSAAAVNTHGFIDNQLYHCYSKQHQKQTKQTISVIEQSATTLYNKPFAEIKPEQQLSVLNNIDQGVNGFSRSQRTHFKRLKLLICFGYYTSEVGASKELRFVAVPGGFVGSVKRTKNEATWGSKGLFY